MNDNTSLSAALGRITEDMLSRRARYGHVALLLAALGLCAVSSALLLTETTLPMRTMVAFVLILAISLCWVCYTLWALRYRRPLLAHHRVIAGRMAVAFCGIFTAGAAWLGFAGGQPSMTMAAALGGAMSAISVALLLRAHRNRARLLMRRRELEQTLSQVQP
jgi:membrane associated rhomboid family serine protease